MKTKFEGVQKVFDPDSWRKNRSKYKILKLLATAKPDTLISFEYLYVNAGIPHSTIAGALKRWRAWRYIAVEDRAGVKTYHILYPGRQLIKKLSTICPRAVAEWDAELREWWGMLPPITDWSRPELKRLLEPLMYHRPATHPGQSIYRAGGCYWNHSGKTYLLTTPYTDYVVKPSAKRNELGSDWVLCRTINDVIAYVAARAPLIHTLVIEELVRKSIRGF